MATILDLSHPVVDGMVTSREASRGRYAPGVEFQIGHIGLVANTGTYVDVPYHRFADGDDLELFPLQRLVDLEGLVVDAPIGDDGRVDGEALRGIEIAGRAVLVRTGWSRHWGQEEYVRGRHPFLDGPTARALVDGGATLVGIDSLNIDSMADLHRPVHSTLLLNGVAIVEHLVNLEALPRTGFRFTAAPPAVRAMGTFTVRAFAVTGENDPVT